MNEEEIIIFITNQNKKLKEEICSLKNKIKEIDNTRAYWHIKNDDKKDKIKQLQNNWNELKKYIEEWLIKNETWYSNSLSIHDKNYYRKDYLLRKANLTEIKNKMQELEQGKDD